MREMARSIYLIKLYEITMRKKNRFFVSDYFNPPMAEGAVGWLSNFSRKWEELFLQTKFLAVGSSLGHLSMKKFLDRTYHLGSKITQREGAGGVATITPWTLFYLLF